LNLYVPAALDTQIATLGSPAAARTLPPPGAETAPSEEQMAEFLDEIKAQASQGWVDIENLLGQPKPAM
jgi:hypothetical protein